MNDTEILATGSEFIKEGVRGIEPVIEDIIRNAKYEIQIVSYILTSYAEHLLLLLDETAKKGIKITIVVNKIESQSYEVQSKLLDMTRRNNNINIINFVGSKKKQVHAKVIVVDRKIAIIGSANFSWTGLYGNYEIGILLRDKNAWKLGKIIDVLVNLGKSYN